jgi:hypothetical protein
MGGILANFTVISERFRRFAARAHTRPEHALYSTGRHLRIDMAGISVTLEGNNIQLAFEKNDDTTAVVMDAGTAQSLVLALGQMLLRIEPEDDGEAFGEDDFLDLTSPTIDVGTDERGQAVVALQAGPLPPFVLRLSDDEARHMASALLEILNSPRDIRQSQGDH